MLRSFPLLTAILVAGCATAPGPETEIAPPAGAMLEIRQASWAQYFAGDTRKGIPADAQLVSISNTQCQRDLDNEQRLGWFRWFTCEFDMNYSSATSGNGVYKDSDTFALSRENGWTNRVLSSK